MSWWRGGWRIVSLSLSLSTWSLDLADHWRYLSMFFMFCLCHDWLEWAIHRLQVSLRDHCRYQYLVNVAGATYSARLKYLLACGSPVIQVTPFSHLSHNLNASLMCHITAYNLQVVSPLHFVDSQTEGLLFWMPQSPIRKGQHHSQADPQKMGCRTRTLHGCTTAVERL